VPDSTRTPADDASGAPLEVEGRFAIVPEAVGLDPGLSDHAVRVYIILVRHGSTPGSCFPSYATIASKMRRGTSPRSVPAWVRELEAAGWVQRVARGQGESNGYRVRTSRPDTPRSAARPPRPAARTPRAPQRADPALHSAPNESKVTKASNESPCSPQVEQQALAGVGVATAKTYATARGHDLMFERFWQLYPRKVGKPKARTAWQYAIARAPDLVIIAGAERYRDDPNREPEYTAHPSTWLNRNGWDDDPQPVRLAGRSKVQQSVARMAQAGSRTAVAGIMSGTHRPAIGGPT